jgi:subtilisin family serine protease
LVTLLFLAAGSARAYPAPASVQLKDKIDPLLFSTSADEEVEFLVYLGEQADLRGARSLATRLEKGKFVFHQLTEVAARTQLPILEMLEKRGSDHRAFWIANMIWVRGDFTLLAELAARPEVARIYANPRVRLTLPAPEPPAGSPMESDTIEWNILKVRAPEVWAAGFTGQGIVIGGQDTGYEWEHPALKEHYRGWNGSSADHNFSWHDAIHASVGNPCGANSPEPCDDFGHGTHTMGTMVGVDSGGINQIGMAPGAKWIGCRNMDQGTGTPASYAECYQWFVAPTDLNDENPDPTQAPHVINNSWSCPPSEGCTDPEVLLSVVEAVRAAGILTVHSAGNSGDDCSTIDTPAAIYDASFTVGASDQNDAMAGFSSRGPVIVDGSGLLKPDISAPGVGILSSVPGGTYGLNSGTSMAGPHVAGLAALLFSARPELIGEVEQVEDLIRMTATPIITSQVCGGIPGDSIPNNTAGWGRIDALAAYQFQEFSLTLTPDIMSLVLPGQTITYAHQLTNTGGIADTYDLALDSSLGWGSIGVDEVSLEPGDTAELLVTVSVPDGASLGDSDVTTLTATSSTDPTVSASVTDTTQVGVGILLPLVTR